MDALEVSSGQCTATQAKLYNAGRILAIVWLVLGICINLLWNFASSYELLGIYGLVTNLICIIGLASGVCIAIGSKPFRVFGLLIVALVTYNLLKNFFYAREYVYIGVSNFLRLFLVISLSVSFYYSLRKTQYARPAYLATMLSIAFQVLVLVYQCVNFTGVLFNVSSSYAATMLDIVNLIYLIPIIVSVGIMIYILYKIGNAAEVEVRELNGELDTTSWEFLSSRMLAGSVVVCLLVFLPFIYYVISYVTVY